MKGYGQFYPVAVASEMFAQRWTPLIIRALCSGRSHFNEIHRGIPLISRTLLAETLRWLESAGVVASSADALAECASMVLPDRAQSSGVLHALGNGASAGQAFDPHNLGSDFLMWHLHHRLALDRLPDTAW